jgi:hypothetical protein
MTSVFIPLDDTHEYNYSTPSEQANLIGKYKITQWTTQDWSMHHQYQDRLQIINLQNNNNILQNNLLLLNCKLDHLDGANIGLRTLLKKSQAQCNFYINKISYLQLKSCHNINTISHYSIQLYKKSHLILDTTKYHIINNIISIIIQKTTDIINKYRFVYNLVMIELHKILIEKKINKYRNLNNHVMIELLNMFKQTEINKYRYLNTHIMSELLNIFKHKKIIFEIFKHKLINIYDQKLQKFVKSEVEYHKRIQRKSKKLRRKKNKSKLLTHNDSIDNILDEIIISNNRVLEDNEIKKQQKIDVEYMVKQYTYKVHIDQGAEYNRIVTENTFIFSVANKVSTNYRKALEYILTDNILILNKIHHEVNGILYEFSWLNEDFYLYYLSTVVDDTNISHSIYFLYIVQGVYIYFDILNIDENYNKLDSVNFKRIAKPTHYIENNEIIVIKKNKLIFDVRDKVHNIISDSYVKKVNLTPINSKNIIHNSDVYIHQCCPNLSTRCYNFNTNICKYFTHQNTIDNMCKRIGRMNFNDGYGCNHYIYGLQCSCYNK